jgi:arabinose-5-phosphate isomerase
VGIVKSNQSLQECQGPVDADLIAWARNTIRQEQLGLGILADSLGISFAIVVRALMACTGRVIVVGMGKSGHIGKKIASTFASTGTPSFFVHPAEASHGDLGMIDPSDVVIAISKSGESSELSDVIGFCVRFGIVLVAITSDSDSSLARSASHTLLVPAVTEACPLGLAPTTSTTMVLALGDALAIACLRMRNFQPTAFRNFHPGGKLGQKLTRVGDVMHRGESLPLVPSVASLAEAVKEISRVRFGCVGIVDALGRLVGVFTDGDLRRSFAVGMGEGYVKDYMNTSPRVVTAEELIEDVLYIFSNARIPSIFICDDAVPIGILHVHDFLQRRLI